MKPYLLIAGYNYYPSHRTGDWIATFETEEDARNKIKESQNRMHRYTVDDIEYDWFHIEDLRDWIYKK